MMLQTWPFASVPLLLFLSGFHAAAEEYAAPTITVSGTHSIRVKPDQAILDFTIDSRGQKVTEAAEDNRKRVANVITFARESGIKPESIHTESLQIRPLFTGKLPQQKMQDPFANAPEASKQETITPNGYSVQRRLRIELQRLDRFEDVYQGLIERGVNQVEQIRFQSTKREALQEETRLQAIRNAKRKAEQMVDELGAALEGVQTIDEQGGSRYRSSDPFAAAISEPLGGSPLPSGIAAGEIKIESSVRIVFRMKNTDLD